MSELLDMAETHTIGIDAELVISGPYGDVLLDENMDADPWSGYSDATKADWLAVADLMVERWRAFKAKVEAQT